MQNRVLLIGIVILILVSIGLYYMNKTKSNNDKKTSKNNLLAGITITNNSFNNDDEGKKMCSSDMLKNTIMSKESEPKVREGLFFIKVGKGLVCESYNWNLKGSFWEDSKQRFEKSNWDIVKNPEYGVFDYTSDVLEMARKRFTDSNSFTDIPQSNEDNPIIIPFLLRFVEKDESGSTKRYVFEIRDARGKYSDFEDYQKVETFSGNQEGIKPSARYIYRWRGFDTVYTNPSGINTIVEGQSSCSGCDSTYSKNLKTNDENPWRIKPGSAIGFTTGYGVTASVGAGYTLDGTKGHIGENDIFYFGPELSSRVHSAKQTTYGYGYLKSVDKSSNANSRITVEVENGKIFIKNDSGYFHYHKVGTIGNIGRLKCDTLYPVEMNKTNNPDRFECELIPVLDQTTADTYHKASINYMKNNWKTIESRQQNLAKFCGNDIRFRDGTYKIDVGNLDQVATNRITKAIEQICACNMNTQYNPSFYMKVLCSDQFIKDNYGIDNTPDGKRYDSIRDTLKCNIPHCSFQKCRNLYDQNKNINGLDFTLFGNPDANPVKDCGSSTMCIINQKFDNQGTMIGGRVNMNATTQCGSVGGGNSGITTKTDSAFEWMESPILSQTINSLINNKSNSINPWMLKK